MEPKHNLELPMDSITNTAGGNFKGGKLQLRDIDNNKSEKNISSSTFSRRKRKLSRPVSKLEKIDGEIYNNNNNNYKTIGSFETCYGNDERDNGTELKQSDTIVIKKENEDNFINDSTHYQSDENTEHDNDDFDAEMEYNKKNKEIRVQNDVNIQNPFLYTSESKFTSSIDVSDSLADKTLTNEDNNSLFGSDTLSVYQDWVLKTYGDQTKTKTVTERKYQRIVRTLKGEIPQCAENSKFRFWVRSKGFIIGMSSDKQTEELYVSTTKGYKKVAVVEKFLEIIRNVHIGRGKRGNRHAGQKRTYRAITESYSFLPREAVTKYLLGCEECKKRSEVDCDAKKTTKKQISISNPRTTKDTAIDYSGINLVSEKKILKPKNLFLEEQYKLTTRYSNDSVSTTSTFDLFETHSTKTLDSRSDNIERNNDNILNLHSDQCKSKEVNEIFLKKNEPIFHNNHYSMSNKKFNITDTKQSLIRTSNSASSTITSQNDITSSNYSESPETPKRPIDLCIKRPNNLVERNNSVLPSDVKNSTHETTSVNFRKRKQSSYLIFRYTTTSTPTDTTDQNTHSKPENTSSSGCESTISRSSDFYNDSALEVSPITNIETKTHKTMMQITTTNRKINIPINIPHYNQPCMKYPESGTICTNRIRHTVGSDLAPYNVESSINNAAGSIADTPSSTVIPSINVPNLNRLYSGQFAQDVRSTTPEPDGDEEKFSVRNGDIKQEELSPGEEVSGLWPGYSGTNKMTPPPTRELSSPLILQETSSIHDETSSSGNKEDEDDDDEDVDDLKTLPHDPERLKAFNMFVRLFVDENLDRIVPISKQPKEKIQAIIDSCTRQFPEFAERARKRIRTYLKSCRRNKRTRDPNTWPETTRPTPAHLTSVQAEQILAQACENESHNAKRMRLGLEPVSQPMPVIPGSEPVVTRATSMDQFSPADTKLSSSVHNNNNNSTNNNNNTTSIKPESPNIPKTDHSISSHSGSPMNGSMTSSSSTNLYRPNFSQNFPRGTTTHSPYPTTPIFGTSGYGTPSVIGNGPTDLSMKPTKPLLSHRLNATEMAAVRQLITGYRESAAFLLRSADELEQLLLQQP